MEQIKDVVVTEKAEEAKSLELCWQASSEQEAENMVKFLADHGIKAKSVTLSYCREFK